VGPAPVGPVIPAVRALGPDVLVVTGDHATPSVLAGHGWQPVPVLVWSRYCGADPVTTFAERACAAGTLGVEPAHHLMSLVMANALRLTKFGA
jgi:2,3-bisphosphoglycerate-independent phosphoglycerate mutase